MTFRQNSHSILIQCGFDKAYPEIVRWGEASWWPKKSLMKFERQGQGPVQTGTPRINPCGIIQGTRYRQVVLLPFA
ncbi:MAG: hypothetical protein V1863_03855, partial [Candidatus Omnitrophota bacterium]